MKNIIILICLFVLYSCCTEHTPAPNNILVGKIKRITLIQTDSTIHYKDTLHFNFYYNQSGFCNLINSDESNWQMYIEKLNDSLLKIKVIQEPFTFYNYVILDAGGRVSKINKLDTTTQLQSLVVNFLYNQNGGIDSISTYFPTGDPFAVDVSNYDYVYNGSNYTNTKLHWLSPISGNQEYTKSIACTFTSFQNNKNIPYQIPYYEPISENEPVAYIAFGGTNFILYVLGLNDIKALMPNNNLTAKRNTATYDYIFNSKNMVTDMQVVDEINPLVQKIKLEYY